MGDYAPEETLSFHSTGKHIYTIHCDALEADVVISVPKLKTHEKVGITCAIKGTVERSPERSAWRTIATRTATAAGTSSPAGTRCGRWRRTSRTAFAVPETGSAT